MVWEKKLLLKFGISVLYIAAWLGFGCIQGGGHGTIAGTDADVDGELNDVNYKYSET